MLFVVGFIIGAALQSVVLAARHKRLARRTKPFDDSPCVWDRLRFPPNNWPKCSKCGMPEIDHVEPDEVQRRVDAANESKP